MFQARERYNFLNRFPHGWPVEKFLKTYLKNKCAYARKRGYLVENTNCKQDWHDDDEEDEVEDEVEEEPEEEEEEEEDNKGKNKETEGENVWGRGNGWGKIYEDDDFYAQV